MSAPTLRIELADDDLGTLERAAFLRREFEAGIFPRGAGQHRRFAKLVRHGMLSVVGYGRDIDREVDADVLIHELTPLANVVLRQRGDVLRYRHIYDRTIRAGKALPP